MGQQLKAKAVEFLTGKGWKPGDTISLHSASELMEQFAGMMLTEAAQKAAKLLEGYDKGDDGFAVEDTIRRLYR
jgi:hypothetical protein